MSSDEFQDYDPDEEQPSYCLECEMPVDGWAHWQQHHQGME